MIKKLRVVGCFMEYEGKFIILHRQPNIKQGNKYGLVAGRVHENETDKQAMLREMKEETGYNAKEEELELIDEYEWKYPEIIYIYLSHLD